MGTFVYRGRNRTALDIHLRFLVFALGAEADGYESVLVTLGAGIRKSAKRVDRADQKFSKVEVLWQLGNYFKHRDEWDPASWKGGSSWTLQAIKAAGLRPGCSGNLRQGADALGNTDYADVTVFQQIIRFWSDDVRKQIRAKLVRPKGCTPSRRQSRATEMRSTVKP
jgi:hypothetical protein